MEGQRRLEEARREAPHPGPGLRSPERAERPAASPPVARVRKNEVAVIVDVDEATSQLLGWSADEIVGRTSLEFIHPDDQQLAVENWMQMLSSHGPGHAVRFRHKHRDGSWVWVTMTNHNLLDDPAANCIIAELVPLSDADVNAHAPDVSSGASLDGTDAQEPRRLHEAIRGREQVLHRLAEALPLGVLQVDASGRVAYTNRRLHSILGRARAATATEQLSTVVPEDRERVTDALEGVLHGGLDSDVEVRLAASDESGDKQVRLCTMALRALTTEAGEVTGAIACITDVTESVRIREELRVRATFDEVTRCHNRASTMAALEQMVTMADGSSAPAVVFVDLNRFKEVNDRFGHGAGDELLATVAKRLLRAVRDSDLVGRIGGDEFLVICPGITTTEQAVLTADRVADALGHRVQLKAATLSCDASIGVAWSLAPDLDADGLVSQADEAMYEAKRHGNPRPVLFAPS